MSRNEIKWILVELSHNLAGAIAAIFIALFLWQTKQDLSIILRYHLALFFTIPFAGLIGSAIAEKVSSKASFLLSFVARIFLLFSASFLQSFFVQRPEAFGLVSAVAIGLFAIPRNAAFQSLINPSNLSRATAILASGSKAINILTPLLGSLWVFLVGSYRGIFILAIFGLLISTLFLFSTKISAGDNRWDIKGVFAFKGNPDFGKLMRLEFFSGVKNGLSWAIFSILVLFLVGNNLPKWGVTSSLINLAGVVSGIIYARYLAEKWDLPTLIFTSVLYTGLAVLFVSNFTFLSLVIFLSVNSLASTFISSSMTPVVAGIIREDPKSALLVNEYYAVIELPLALGRILPLIILLIANAQLEYDPVLRFVFLVIGTMPLISVSILRKTSLFKAKVGTI